MKVKINSGQLLDALKAHFNLEAQDTLKLIQINRFGMVIDMRWPDELDLEIEAFPEIKEPLKPKHMGHATKFNYCLTCGEEMFPIPEEYDKPELRKNIKLAILEHNIKTKINPGGVPEKLIDEEGREYELMAKASYWSDGQAYTSRDLFKSDEEAKNKICNSTHYPFCDDRPVCLERDKDGNIMWRRVYK